LKRLRTQQVLSLRELAQRSGVSHDAIMFIERGMRQPRPSTIRKLAHGLGIPPETLILWGEGGETDSGSEDDQGKAAA
jgi:transcriptional regulator with XRE-family HTH domain